MPPVFKLIPDFILPNLEKATYGRHLIWEDKRKGSFKISRIHQSSEQWSDDCIAVYKAWSLKKRLWGSNDPKRVTKAKHRLVSALRRNTVVETLEKESGYYRFRLINCRTSDTKASKVDSKKKNNSCLQKLESIKSNSSDVYFSRVYEMQLTEKEVCVGYSNKETDKIAKNEISNTVFVHETELNYGFKIPFASSKVFSESSKNNSWSSGKCCCDILLDSTLLLNEMCIWHGNST